MNLLRSRVAIGLAALMVTASFGITSLGAAAAAKKATPSTWKIGAIVDETGAASAGSLPAAGALKAWVKWSNAHGGIDGGHKVSLILLDTQSSPSVALQDANTLIHDHVMAFVGGDSVFASTYGTAVQKAGIPQIGGDPSASGNPWGVDSNFYAADTSAASIVALYLQAMVKLHETKLGVPYCTIAAACDAILTALAPLTGPLGITVTSAAVSDPSTTFAGPCLTFKNAGDQAIIPILEPSDIQPFVDTCAQQGLNPTWIFGAVYPFELSDSNAAGSITYLEDFNWTAPGPVATTYRAAMKKYDPSIYTSLAPGEGTAQWASALMFQYAAKLTKAKTPTGKQLIKALNTFKNQTLGGATPPLTFTNGQRYSAACAAQLGVAYGKFIAPDGNGYICSPKS